MYLHRKDVEKINTILEKFSDVDVFKIEQDSSSGIGSVTVISFDHEVNGVSGNFTIEVSGSENW